MATSIQRAAATLGWSFLLGAASSAQSTPPTAPFRFEVDRVEGANVTLANFPVRPLVVLDTNVFWAVNHHDSTIERFDASGSTPTVPTHRVGVPWNPVGIAYWDGPTSGSSDDELIVTCRGTWSVVRVDLTTLAIRGLVQLRPGDTPCGKAAPVLMGMMAEPADVVVDNSTNQAFVSCPGVDSVIQIDLASSQVARVFHESYDSTFQVKAPTFLYLKSNGHVLVAPLLSGNDSGWKDGLTTGYAVDDLSTRPGGGVADEDLFEIVPSSGSCGSGSQGSVAAVTGWTAVGTTLFAHGLNPITGEHWQLNTNAVNTDPDKQSEPTIQGEFLRDRVTFATSSGPAHTVVSLDPATAPDGNSDTQLTAAIGQPFALAFDPRGRAFITGLLTDNVAVLSSSHDVLGVIPLSTSYDPLNRQIPRGVVVRSTSGTYSGTILVYCWGDNTIREFGYTITSGVLSHTVGPVYQLTYDPTPPERKPGRSIFFDATNSKHHNVSCASCHIEAGTDLLVWNLSNRPDDTATGHTYVPADDKAGMLTQLLVGLERVGPFHWRGERDLPDFNGAFAGLLGGDELETADFEKLQTYLFSLVNPANPHENRKRVVDDAITYSQDTTSAASATAGQDAFLDDLTLQGSFRCLDCHSTPTGTINDVNDEILGTAKPRLANRKPAPFHELWKKEQTPETITIDTAPTPDLTIERGFLGTGLDHTGGRGTLFEFHGIVGTTVADRRDITAFVNQWDQGLAPAAHFGFFWTGSQSGGQGEIDYLVDQAEAENCDAVILGMYNNAGTPVYIRWYYDRANDVFVSDKPSVITQRTKDAFDTVGSTEWFVFLGLPAGMGERFAIDYDFDGVLNGQESASTLYDPAQPGGGYSGSPSIVSGSVQVLWETAKVARVLFETSEPTQGEVHFGPQYGWPSAAMETAESTAWSKRHSVLLTGLHPSTDNGDWATGVEPQDVPQHYEFDITVTDRNNNSYATGTTTPAGAFDTLSFIRNPTVGSVSFQPASNVKHRQRLLEHYIRNLSATTPSISSGVVTFQVTADVNFKRGVNFNSLTGQFEWPAAAERAIVGRVFFARADGTYDIGTPSATGTLSSTGKSVIADVVRLEGPPTTPPTPRDYQSLFVTDDPDGNRSPFVVASERTDAGGSVTFEVQVSLPSGTQPRAVVFVVDAVIEVLDPTNWGTALSGSAPNRTLTLSGVVPGTAYAGDASNLGLSQWSFPDTKEKNALVLKNL